MSLFLSQNSPTIQPLSRSAEDISDDSVVQVTHESPDYDISKKKVIFDIKNPDFGIGLIIDCDDPIKDPVDGLNINITIQISRSLNNSTRPIITNLSKNINDYFKELCDTNNISINEKNFKIIFKFKELNYYIKYKLISLIQNLKDKDILHYEHKQYDNAYIKIVFIDSTNEFIRLYKSLSIKITLDSDNNIDLIFNNVNSRNKLIRDNIMEDIMKTLDQNKIIYSEKDNHLIINTNDYNYIKQLFSKYNIFIGTPATDISLKPNSFEIKYDSTKSGEEKELQFKIYSDHTERIKKMRELIDDNQKMIDDNNSLIDTKILEVDSTISKIITDFGTEEILSIDISNLDKFNMIIEHKERKVQLRQSLIHRLGSEESILEESEKKKINSRIRRYDSNINGYDTLLDTLRPLINNLVDLKNSKLQLDTFGTTSESITPLTNRYMTHDETQCMRCFEILFCQLSVYLIQNNFNKFCELLYRCLISRFIQIINYCFDTPEQVPNHIIPFNKLYNLYKYITTIDQTTKLLNFTKEFRNYNNRNPDPDTQNRLISDLNFFIQEWTQRIRINADCNGDAFYNEFIRLRSPIYITRSRNRNGTGYHYRNYINSTYINESKNISINHPDCSVTINGISSRIYARKEYPDILYYQRLPDPRPPHITSLSEKYKKYKIKYLKLKNRLS